MTDPIRLVMEETGCDGSQAELALAAAGYNIPRAIRHIRDLLRDITVTKVRFMSEAQQAYGVLALIVNTRHRTPVRLAAVVSQNPAVCEPGLDIPWTLFERQVYSSRIQEGAQQPLTHTVERRLSARLEDASGTIYDFLKEGNSAEIQAELRVLIGTVLQAADLNLNLQLEQLNLTQLREMRESAPPAPIESAPPRAEETESTSSGSETRDASGGDSPPPVIELEVELPPAPSGDAGLPVRDLTQGDWVEAVLTDSRDIAQYLGRLLGGQPGATLLGVVELAGPVAEGRRPIRLRFGPGIAGITQSPEDLAVRVARRVRRRSWLSRWWLGTGS